MYFASGALITTLFSLASPALGQSAIPPSTFPDASTTRTTSGSSTSNVQVTFTVTTTTSSASGSTSASRSVSGSGTASANATSTLQFPPLNTVSPCVSNCLATSISTVGCASIVDVNCFCPIARFPLTYLNCLIGTCPNDSVTAAETLASEFCRLSNSTSTTLTFPAVPQTSMSASGSGTTTITVAPAGATNATSTNAAVAMGAFGGWGTPGGGQGLAGGTVVLLSILVGAVVI